MKRAPALILGSGLSLAFHVALLTKKLSFVQSLGEQPLSLRTKKKHHWADWIKRL